MDIKSLLPKSEQLTRLKDIEGALLRRRTAGTLAGVLALGTAAVQVVAALSQHSDKLGEFLLAIFSGNVSMLSGPSAPQALGMAVIFFGAVGYLSLRWTGVLVKESKEPFRYTFSIRTFTWVENTPGTRCELVGRDRFALLHHDLTDRLNRRIPRFSVLDEAAPAASDKEGVAKARRSSHIQIAGLMALREERGGDWVVQITPLIRIGPAGAPVTLAPPVSYTIGRKPAPGPAPANASYTLSAVQYDQIVERVYSHIATEVYAQIEEDVRRKIQLFPTPYLRAVALYHEAEDFARSNTVDAFERAIDLYRDALRYFDVLRIDCVTRWLLTVPVLWRLEIAYHHQWARLVTGYARCLVYKRTIATIAGRRPSALFELPERLDPILKNLQCLHRRMTGARVSDASTLVRATLEYPRDSWDRFLFGRISASVFETQKRTLFELCLADALVSHGLSALQRAEASLERAKAIAPERAESEALYLVARGQLSVERYRRLSYYQQAVDIAPNFQLARWLLAQASENEFRLQDEITAARARPVMDEYEAVLKLNNGSIAAYTALGSLLWLVKDPNARDRLLEGREVKAIARGTFIGEINYRLARIAAEAGEYDSSYSYYTEALAADPAVAAYAPLGDRVNTSDSSDVGRKMLERFEQYKNDVESAIATARPKAAEGAPLSDRTLRVVQAFVLNDYANVSLTHFHNHGDHESLKNAIAAYEKATAINPDDALPWFNIQNAYGWDFEATKAGEALERARKLAPAWPIVITDAARDTVVKTVQQIEEAERLWRENMANLKQLQAERDELQAQLLQLDAGNLPEAQLSAADSGPALFTIARGAVAAIERDEQKLAEALRTNPHVIKALRAIEHEQIERPEGALLERIEDELGRSLTHVERRKIRSQAFRLATSSATGAGADAAAIRTTREDRMAALEKREIPAERKAVATREEAVTRLKERLDGVMSKALEAIASHSRFPALYEGGANVQDWVDRLCAIPWANLNDADARTMRALAVIFTTAVNRPEYLAAGVRLASHLRAIGSEDDDLVRAVVEALDRGIDSLPVDARDWHQKVLADCRASWERIVTRWVDAGAEVFVSMYWYVSVGDASATDRLDRLRRDHFDGREDVFDHLVGHAYYRLAQFDKAAEAYQRAAQRRPDHAPYHYHHGAALSWTADWAAARSAHQRAHDLVPDNAWYAAGLAEAYNQFGNRFYGDERYANAADQYAHATRLDPRNATYFSNLALGLEELVADDPSLVPRAIQALETACRLAPATEAYRVRLERVLANRRARDVYGPAPAFDDEMTVTRLAFEVAKDLGEYILDTDTGELPQSTATRLAAWRARFKAHYGIEVPAVKFRFDRDENLESTYTVFLDEIPMTRAQADPRKRLCLASMQRLKDLKIDAESAPDQGGEAEAVWIKEDAWAAAAAANLELLDPLDLMLRQLETLVSGNLPVFLGHQEVFALLAGSPTEAVSALARDGGIPSLLLDALRGLVAERVSIVALEDLCQLHLAQPPDITLMNLVEKMRRLEPIRHRLPGNDKESTRLSAGRQLSETIRSGIVGGPVPVLALEPEACQRVLSAVRMAVDGVTRPALVVDDPAIRAHLRVLVELEFPSLPVLARDELLPGIDTDASRSVEVRG